jgi:hypothetical protein
MRFWLLRGGVLAVVHAAAQTVVAAFTVRDPTGQGTIAAIVLGVLVGAAAVWGVLDRWRAVPRPEIVWLIAALVAGDRAVGVRGSDRGERAGHRAHRRGGVHGAAGVRTGRPGAAGRKVAQAAGG